MTDAVANAAEPSGRRDTAGLQARKRSRRRAVARWLAAGAGMGLLLRTSAGQAEAADGDTVRAGQTTDATAPTRLRTNAASLAPDTTADGVQGYADGANNAGLFGRNNAANGIGVAGAAPSGTGVFGQSANGYGVGGQSDANHGVYGKSASGNGVWGEAASGHGVVGTVTGSNEAVLGMAPSGIALRGDSAGSIGVVGATATGVGVYGTASSTGYAGYFAGPVYISGTLSIGGSKSAVVPHPDGTLRRLYCLESPESYFEDIGRGQLTNGRAQVPIDPEFGAVVRTSSYEVFLTPRGECRGLYVASQTPTGFEVRELQGGTSTVAFSYRILALRKDVTAPRLERVVPPARVSLPRLPDLPGVVSTP